MGFLFFKGSKIIKQHEFFEVEKEEKNTKLGLKIHICGNNSHRKDVINELFSSTKITDNNYTKRATNEFKTDQFYWIAKIYKDFSEKIIEEIMHDIENDIDKEKPNITQQVILCFFSEKNKNSLSLFDKIQEDIHTPLFIVISEEEIQKFGKVDQRKVTNIICRNMNKETLNSRIISALWDYDCYYNEKGNKICRYSPDNIFKSLEVDLSFHSINILLTGKSRAGKSTFINYLSNKLNALESSAKDSVTQSLTEYYLYSSINDKTEHTSIKLIDTPGLTPNNIDKSKEFLEELIKNENNNMEKQIHFILFFFMEGESLEGADTIFDLLNNCNIPVLFIINKAFNDDDDGKTKDINSTISFFKRKNYNNLTEKKNYIGVNIVKTGRIGCFGVDEVFQRINEIYKENNKFNKETKDKIRDFIKNYHSEMLKENEEINNKLAKEINILKEELDKAIIMFKYLNIDSIIKAGKKPAIRCKNVINSLSNISEKMNIFENDNEKNISAISFFQAFMVKEIGEIFGYNTSEMTYGIRLYLTQINRQFDKENYSLPQIQKEEICRTINISQNIIENQIKSEYAKSNKEFILYLANLFKKIKLNYNKKELSDDMVNKQLTNEICFCCMNYLEEQLKKTNGLIFFTHYYDICEKISQSLEEYSKTDCKEWGKKQIKVIKE